MEIEMDTYASVELPPAHYYGDIVRKIFVFCAVLITLEYVFFSTYILLPASLSIISAIALMILAGLQSPEQHGLSYLNALVSVFACFIFAYTGFTHYLHSETFNPWFFWSNQVLALAFLTTTYYGFKTIRAIWNIEQKDKKTAIE